jgi:hypothetical protein|tara:strand:- start:76 stop:249 length:174 start_codon:yes stop_codon:yes gene_type:complete
MEKSEYIIAMTSLIAVAEVSRQGLDYIRPRGLVHTAEQLWEELERKGYADKEAEEKF